jgi:hypothetical protein
MNTKHLELIYQYMGWCSHSNGDIIPENFFNCMGSWLEER